MPLDIIIQGSFGKEDKFLPVFMDEYDIIMEKIADLDNFPFIKRIFADYYGDAEVWINELPDLKKEVESLKEYFDAESTRSVMDFINQFDELIQYAILNREKLQIVAD